MLWNGVEFVQAVGHNQNINIDSSCEVCKYSQKKCSLDCVFARYFPPGKESRVRVHNMRLLFGVDRVAKLLNHYKPPLTDGIMQSIIFESNDRSINPTAAGWVYRYIRNLQREILQTITDLQNIEAQLRPYWLASKQGHTSSTSGRKQLPSFDSSTVYYICRNCRTSISLCEDFYCLKKMAPHRGFFIKVINLHTSGKELLRDDGPEEVNLYCDDCGIHLGMKIAVEAATEGPFATKSIAALQLDKLLLWNGKYALEAVPSPAKMPRVAAPIGPAPVAAPIRQLGAEEITQHFARQDPVQEQVVIIEDDNETTQDQIWDNLEAQDGAGNDAL